MEWNGKEKNMEDKLKNQICPICRVKFDKCFGCECSDSEENEFEQALKRACQFVADHTGTCPHDYSDGDWVHPEECAMVCDNSSSFGVSCWILYFLSKGQK
jgi:hypothetical protein